MKELDQWIVWREESREGQVKPTKVPFCPRTQHRADPLNPMAWMSHAAAVATGYRIGFVFTATDPYFFLDLDSCLTDTGWSDQSAALLARFPGAQSEVSVSGRGLHVFGRYSGARPDHGTRCGAIGGELYTADRFAAIGAQQTGDPTTDHTLALLTLAAQYFPPVDRGQGSADWTDAPCDGWTGTSDDDELIRKARAAGANPFSGETNFEALWTANADELGKRYPDASREYDGSSADAALAKHLAFWTGNDCERIERLMRQSELVRDKWDRLGYLEATVAFAVAHTTKVYDYVAPAPAAATDTPVSGYNFVSVQDQVKLWQGYIYVASRHRVMLPDGRLLGPQQFNAVIPSAEFARDDTGKSTPTRKPWEALTESLAFVVVSADQICFEPQLPWDRPIERSGLTYANTYRPIDTPRQAGDPTRFLDHVAKLLPVEHDREIILAYMAAVIQHKGVKFQYAPLIQGCEGNGKTLLTTVLIEAIGKKYVFTPQANDMDNKFNSWLLGKIFIGVEDICVPIGAKGNEMMDVLKPMITNRTAGIQPKGCDQELADICCNFMLNSNRTNAVPTSENDRRFAHFHTAQQDASDILRDGMGGDYFPELYDWLRAEGYAIVHDYLATYAIPDELNPATKCQRAPRTSSTAQAITNSSTPLEQEIADLVAERKPGFRGSWISRTALTDWLRMNNRRTSIQAQRETLERIGYKLAGRSAFAVAPDEKRSELWVARDSLASQVADFADAYSKAQGDGEQTEHTGRAV